MIEVFDHLKRAMKVEPAKLPPAPDLATFDVALKRATALFLSNEFWKQFENEQRAGTLMDFKREDFLAGFERPIDDIVIAAVRERLKGGVAPFVVEVGCGYSVGHGVAHGAPWLSRKLAAALGREHVLATTCDSLAYYISQRERVVPLHDGFEDRHFGLNVKTDVNYHSLGELKKGSVDILFGRCLDSMYFDVGKFQRAAYPIHREGGTSFVEVCGKGMFCIQSFERSRVNRRMSLRETTNLL